MGWWRGGFSTTSGTSWVSGITWVLHEAAPIQMRMGSGGGVRLSFSCGWSWGWWGVGCFDLHKRGWGWGVLGCWKVVALVGATWGELCIECSMHICQVFGVCNNKVS